ncbi:uncharacterized protein [Diadema antillarum]|uniref:uncharacterized protein n=1 Tax=Diadema antillarum TaxID=105358 RepID=UPI003A8A41C4
MAGRPEAPTHIVPAEEIMARDEVLADILNIPAIQARLQDKRATLSYLARTGLISNQMTCERFDRECRLNACNDRSDGYVWRCVQCRNRISVRRDSFFSKSHVPLEDLVFLVYLWCEDVSLEFIQKHTNVSRHTACAWTNFLREVCSLYEIDHFEQLGGFDEGGNPIIVEVDESKYSHRKYHRGQWREGHWVLGAIKRRSNRCVLREVESRDRETLEPIIQEWCLPGTHIMTDGWAAYNQLHTVGDGVYLHDVVIHEHRFVDPVHRDVHTNGIEGLWMHAKRKLRRPFGTYRELFPGYLDEFMFRWNSNADMFAHLLIAIREQYPV